MYKASVSPPRSPPPLPFRSAMPFGPRVWALCWTFGSHLRDPAPLRLHLGVHFGCHFQQFSSHLGIQNGAKWNQPVFANPLFRFVVIFNPFWESRCSKIGPTCLCYSLFSFHGRVCRPNLIFSGSNLPSPFGLSRHASICGFACKTEAQ